MFNKIIMWALGLALFCPLSSEAQFKSQSEQPGVSQSLIRPATSISSLLGLIDPNRFAMRHNFSLGYLSAGGSGQSMASYTNSMFYQISNPLNVRFDVTLMGSPFGGSGVSGANSFNKLLVSRAELNYRPWENFFVRFQYRQLPSADWYSRQFAAPYYWGDE